MSGNLIIVGLVLAFMGLVNLFGLYIHVRVFNRHKIIAEVSKKYSKFLQYSGYTLTKIGKETPLASKILVKLCWILICIEFLLVIPCVIIQLVFTLKLVDIPSSIIDLLVRKFAYFGLTVQYIFGAMFLIDRKMLEYTKKKKKRKKTRI